MPGFKNAKEIDYYAEGMQIVNDHAAVWSVVHVYPNEEALAVRHLAHARLYPLDREKYTLYMDSIWRGRKYTCEEYTYTVRFVDDNYVAPERDGYTPEAWPRDRFLSNFTPVPIEEPWEPKEGGRVSVPPAPCTPHTPMEGTVLHLHGDDAWVLIDGQNQPWTVATSSLSPVPVKKEQP